MSIYTNLQIGGEQPTPPEASAGQPTEMAALRAHSGGQTESLGAARYNTAEALQVGSIRAPGGGLVAGRAPRDTDYVRVNVDGYVTDVKYATARRMGWLPPEEPRNADTPEKQPAQAQEPQEQGPAPSVDPAAQAKAELSATLPGSTADRVLSDLLQSGELNVSLVQQMGGNVEHVQAAVAKVASQMAAHQAEFLDSVNVDPAHFRQWADKHARTELRTAIRKHHATGDATAYSELADKYLRSVEPSEEAMRAAGCEVFTDRNTRQRMVRLPNGMTMSVRAAVRGRIFR